MMKMANASISEPSGIHREKVARKNVNFVGSCGDEVTASMGDIRVRAPWG
jgi:hypothetical protein